MAWTYRRRGWLARIAPLAFVLLAGALAPVGLADDAVPGGSVTSPAPGTVFIEGPSYIIPIRWNATCQNRDPAELVYHHWSVNIHITRTTGSNKGLVDTQSLEYVGVNDSSKGPREQGMVVTLAPGVQRETYEVKVLVLCYGTPTVIGTVLVTVALKTHPTTTTTAGGGSGTPGGSKGGAQGCVVPKVVGKTLAVARRALVAAHCSVGVVRRVVSTHAMQGRVVSQAPPAGTKRAAGAAVALALGKGPKRS